jgi:hypothetical protein
MDDGVGGSCIFGPWGRKVDIELWPVCIVGIPGGQMHFGGVF